MANPEEEDIKIYGWSGWDGYEDLAVLAMLLALICTLLGILLFLLGGALPFDPRMPLFYLTGGAIVFTILNFISYSLGRLHDPPLWIFPLVLTCISCLVSLGGFFAHTPRVYIYGDATANGELGASTYEHHNFFEVDYMRPKLKIRDGGAHWRVKLAGAWTPVEDRDTCSVTISKDGERELVAVHDAVRNGDEIMFTEGQEIRMDGTCYKWERVGDLPVSISFR